jgi:hypothetical protein
MRRLTLEVKLKISFNTFEKNINIFAYTVILIAGPQKNPILLILKENRVTMRMLNIYL